LDLYKGKHFVLPFLSDSSIYFSRNENNRRRHEAARLSKQMHEFRNKSEF